MLIDSNEAPVYVEPVKPTPTPIPTPVPTPTPTIDNKTKIDNQTTVVEPI